MLKLFVSINTTGLDTFREDIIEMSYIIYENTVLEKGTFKVKPRKGKKPSEISKDILKINKVTIDELRDFENPEVSCHLFIDTLKKYKGNLTLCGHNVKFIGDFLDNFLRQYTDGYSLSNFVKRGGGLDLMYVFPLLTNILGVTVEDYRLKTLANSLGVPLVQHCTSSKVGCTLTIYTKIVKALEIGYVDTV